ncbi:MAG: RNA-binding S4 domain-containing protein [Candidatus Rokubacteria bacterium]|nr:RNA-binding S4 domain-containing protein [Candidatus Rokubacteria bacterium]
MTEEPPSLRVDKWLWTARVFKTRSLAAAACAGGKVDVNGAAAKPSKSLRAGDLVRVTLPRGWRRVVKVLKLHDRRGPAVLARGLYEDLTPPEPARVRAAPPALRPPGAGRPTKRERRHLERLRGL